MAAHAFNPSRGRDRQISEFEVSLVYREKPCLGGAGVEEHDLRSLTLQTVQVYIKAALAAAFWSCPCFFFCPACFLAFFC